MSDIHSNIQKSKYKQKFNVKKHKRPSLEVNLKGFICSCNNREKDCVKESYNLLNKYADILYPPPANTDTKDDTDIGDELRNELLELTSIKTKRFQVVESGAKNMIFIKTTLEDTVQLAEKIISDIAETKSRQTKVLLRLVPIEVTCKAYVKDIENAFKRIAPKHFAESSKTFSVVYNHRNNNNLKRDDVIKAVADVVFQIRSDHRVSLKDAEVSVVIEVIKGIALIGIVPDFIKYKKYNLHAISEHDNETESQHSGELEDLHTESNDT
ncbi:THUMP domain-containing protein 1 homolog [Anoplophora glabripennis]|nr:THUMP domain-containing protein 1 homolog [Anoplophora glabripennis]